MRTAFPSVALALTIGALPGGMARPGAAGAQLPPSSLAVREGEGDAWRTWWRSDAAPAQWSAALTQVTDAARWTHPAEGLSVGELQLAGTGEAKRVRVVLVRVDAARYEFRVDVRRHEGRGRALPWSVDDAPDNAALAVNAGQFTSGGPWGWVVHEGIERRAAGGGPLAPAFIVDTAGRVRLVPPDSIAATRRAGAVREAFQSYPSLLLDDGRVPGALADSGRGVDVAHRDARLAIGLARDGTVLIALTRFDGAGPLLSRVPLGLTTPEMAAVMGALGCRQAVMLDGGISGQLLVRDSSGVARAWRGLRRVPLGLVAIRRR